MSNIKKLMMTAAGGDVPLNVEDVFSTYLYTGTGSNQTITNGIDLSGEGGMTWIKRRNSADSHVLTDSERGYGQVLQTDTTGKNQNLASLFNLSTTSSGFTIGSNNTLINNSASTYTSWTFRKAPKFFDVVTYTGNGSSTNVINHNLGVVPGFIIIKNLSTSGYAWACQHKDLSISYLELNNSNASQGGYLINPITSTTFNVLNNGSVNSNGDNYVAYLFAHNDGDGDFGPTGDQDIIKCGSYTGNGSSTGPEIDLGFEPQFVIIKRTDTSTYDWVLQDTMRGMLASGGGAFLKPNASTAEYATGYIGPQPTGFRLTDNSSQVNASGGTYIYIAIRRGPMAVPESATDVFAVEYNGQTSTSAPGWYSGFPVDWAFYRNKDTDQDFLIYTRLTQGKGLYFRGDAEFTDAQAKFDFMDGYYDAVGSNSSIYSWMWKRAPSFFDVVTYKGNLTARTIGHNLGVAPEMMWIKQRDATKDWCCYHSSYAGTDDFIYLNYSNGTIDYGNFPWNSTAPTSSVFSLGANGLVNANGNTYVAYLFASLDGVSKVGSYTGNGSTQTINCGFSSGARFVLIKRTDSTGDWYVWDTARGIVAANDPHLALNRNDQAEVTTDDSIDPVSSGFAVNQVAATNINVSSASYIFYAIA